MISFSQVASRFGSVLDDITGLYVPTDDLETTISDLAMDTVIAAAAALFVLTLLAMLVNQKIPKLKLPVFILIVIVMVGSTFTLIGSTIYLNVSADSGGPVHWHADTEIWACGNELELRDPTGFLSNKIGTATLHEHNDKRIHLEGVVVDEIVDASLGKYFYVIGGAITEDAMVVPLNEKDNQNIYEDEEDGDGPSDSNPALVNPYIVEDEELGTVASFRDGDSCGEETAEVQVFVYNLNEDGDTYEQRKLDNPRDYVIFDDSNVPPGDCVIFEFGPEVEKTDKLCDQYGIRDIERCEEFGVLPEQREICTLTQVNYDSNIDYRVIRDNESQATTESSATSAPADEDESDIQELPTDTVVHSDPTIERLRLNCELSGDQTITQSPACAEYQETLDQNPEAQAEADAAAAEDETLDQTETSEEQAEV